MNNVSNNVIKKITKHWRFCQRLQGVTIYGIYDNNVEPLGVLPPYTPIPPPSLKRGEDTPIDVKT